MEPQPGDEPIDAVFVFDGRRAPKNRAVCYLTYTTEETHAIIRQNLHRSAACTPASSRASGARYCPSIEDKVVRFPGQAAPSSSSSSRWGLTPMELYVQGFSTSMPEEVQIADCYRTDPGP